MIQAKSHKPAWSTKALALGLLLAAVLSASIVLATSKPVHASTTFTVTTTSDSGAGSLRQAILNANATPGADTINFNIPSSGVRTIFPRSPLPEITEAVTIDGYTQPGTSANTLSAGTSAVLKVQLDGSSAGSSADGLFIRADNVVVRGLVINRFGQTGVQIDGNNNRVEGNFVGTGATGTLDLGNGLGGVLVRGDSNDLGGTSPFQRNLISGNDSEGVSLNAGTEGNTVLGNLIGTTKDGKGNLGNELDGVAVNDSDRNFIGSGLAQGSNTIAFNGGDGVKIESFGSSPATGNRVIINSIFSNAGLGIDLVGGTENTTGTTKNDPGDADGGSNNLQNKPVITSATNSGGTTTVKGKLNSIPNASFDVVFYSNPSDNEGKKFIGATNVRTNASGNATFSFSTAQTVAPGQRVTAWATDAALGNTSEFSAPRTVVAQ
jgi:hypothetical protein